MSARLRLPFLEVKLSMITSQYLGETSKNIDKVFELAKKLSPCILFIDEFDFVAKTRTSDEHAAIKRAVNTLLKCIDEISLVNDGVLLIGATNHPKLLDNAVWRRFDEIVMFPLPNEEMRKKIFELVLKPIEGSFDIDDLAKKTENYAGSDLRLIVREAVLNALTEDRTKLDQGDMLNAVKQFEERINLRLNDDQSG
jgi:SpoVK/Ycf46/Vps4 family AAA+-type ATPase